MVEAIGSQDSSDTRGYCMACFTGNYPTEIYPDTYAKEEIEKAETVKNKTIIELFITWKW